MLTNVSTVWKCWLPHCLVIGFKGYCNTEFPSFCCAPVRRNNRMKANGLDFSFLGQLTSICLLLRCPLEWILRFDHPITSIGLALNASSGKILILKLNSAGFKTKFLMSSTRILIEFRPLFLKFVKLCGERLISF